MLRVVNLFLASTALLAFLLFVPQNSFGQTRKPGLRTIVLDPGHGGKDPGTVWENYKEKDINLSVAKMLGEMIKKNLPDVNVIYTRQTDVFIPLNQRGEIANNANADLFLSIHVNAVDRGRRAPSGALTLVMGVDKAGANLDIAMRENDVIKYEEDYTETYQGYEPGSTESFIIFSLMQYINLDQSLMFADILQKHYVSDSPMPDLGVRQQGLLVLWKTTMPSVLTELGFLPNEHDRKVMVSADGQRKLATAIFNAVSEYKARVEGLSAPLQLDTDGVVDDTTVRYVTVDRPQTAVAGSSAIVYRIQIMSATKKVGRHSNEFKTYRGKVTERKEGGRFKYFVGECRSYSEASAMQAEVRRTFPDAFMVAFDGDAQIAVSDARKLTDR